jgi:hypothetical protein
MAAVIEHLPEIGQEEYVIFLASCPSFRSRGMMPAKNYDPSDMKTEETMARDRSRRRKGCSL